VNNIIGHPISILPTLTSPFKKLKESCKSALSAIRNTRSEMPIERPIEAVAIPSSSFMHTAEEEASVAFFNALPEHHLLERPVLTGTISEQASQIQTWVDTAEGFDRVQYLDVRGKNLKALPAWIGKFTGVHILQLEGNQLKELPEEIGNCTKLSALFVGNNHLEKLPESIGNLPLIDLVLNNNRLTTLPDTFGRLYKLENLRLDNNLLTHFPERMDHLTSLITIHIKGNDGFELNADLKEQFQFQMILHGKEETRLGDARTEYINAKNAAEQSAANPPSSIEETSVSNPRGSFYSGYQSSPKAVEDTNINTRASFYSGYQSSSKAVEDTNIDTRGSFYSGYQSSPKADEEPKSIPSPEASPSKASFYNGYMG